MPLRSLTLSIYPLATFARSAFSPRSSNSSSVVGTQNGSWSYSSYLDQILRYTHVLLTRTHPLKISCGLAAPEVRLRISTTQSQRIRNRFRVSNMPSANPKLSTTGSNAETVKKLVPSFISSATTLPRLFATTP